MSASGDPFCDFLGVTVPAEVWESLRPEVGVELDALGMHVEVDQEKSVLWRVPGQTGTVRADRRGKVWSMGASGAVCAGLRAAGRFNAFLSAIGSRPHRVTRLDASLDVRSDAAPVVAEVTRAGRAGELTLTRKAITPGDVTTITGVRADGAVSGTVYVGSRRADVRMVVYDKEHERAARKLPACGPLTRYELRLRSRTGVSLRDAALPAAVFWHYASPDFVTAPPGVPEWDPATTGFEIQRSQPMLPAARLVHRVASSPEIRALIALAAECGPYGVELLCSRIRALAGGAGVSPALTASNGVVGAAELTPAAVHSPAVPAATTAPC